MRLTQLFATTALIAAMIPLPAGAQLFVSVSFGAPPPIPVYYQPPAPGPNYLWEPGYWAWDPTDGYYWVPGTWVLAPQVGFLWTPGYWGWSGNGYSWNAGYWGPSVGFYGGVNYGYGYYGNGFVGGRWSGSHFHYNTYVTNVNTAYIHNTYVDRNVHVNRNAVRVSYDGGRGGLSARPDPQQIAAGHERRIPMTATQRTHQLAAAHEHSQFASVNHGRPVQAAMVHPYASEPRTTAYRPAEQRPEPRPAAQAEHAPAYHAQAEHPAYHAPATQVQHPAYHPQAAPAYHAPAYHPQAAPAAHAAPQQGRPAGGPNHDQHPG